MATHSPNLEMLIATHSSLGGAPVRKVGRQLPVSAELVANGWLSWSSPNGAVGRAERAPCDRSPARLLALSSGARRAA